MAVRTLQNQRLFDLVRHQRGALHEQGLITDDEYTELAVEGGAVDRLEDYIGLRAQLEEAKKAAPPGGHAV